MKATTEGKEARTNPLSDIGAEALKNWEQTVRNGAKLQEEAGRCWVDYLNKCTSAQEWQERVNDFTAAATSLMPVAQKRMEEVMDLANKTSRAGSDFVKQATEAAQTVGLAESQAKWADLWASSLGLARSNAEAVMQINRRALDAWIEFAQKNIQTAQSRA